MATATTSSPRSVNLGVKIGDVTLFATATGLKAGARGKVHQAGEVLGLMGKGAARRVRKALNRLGRRDLAATPRLTA